MLSASLPAIPDPAPDPLREGRLRDAAQRLEAGFIKEMLESAGLGRTPGAMGGGAGEDQFASLLLEEQALRLARAGGIGFAQSLFDALAARDA